MRPKWARWPANRPDWPVQSLRRRVWATRFFENSVPDAFDAHFFNGLIKVEFALVQQHAGQAGFESGFFFAVQGARQLLGTLAGDWRIGQPYRRAVLVACRSVADGGHVARRGHVGVVHDHTVLAYGGGAVAFERLPAGKACRRHGEHSNSNTHDGLFRCHRLTPFAGLIRSHTHSSATTGRITGASNHIHHLFQFPSITRPSLPGLLRRDTSATPAIQSAAADKRR